MNEKTVKFAGLAVALLLLGSILVGARFSGLSGGLKGAGAVGGRFNKTGTLTLPQPGVNRTPLSGTTGEGAGFTALKQSLLNRIDRALGVLDNIEAKVGANPDLGDETKNAVVDALEKIEAGLYEYRSEVEDADSVQELKEINQELIQYLLDNKDVVKENIKKAIIELGEQALAYALEVIDKLEKILKVLKFTCPQERDTISELETQLIKLEDEVAALEDALKEEDVQAIKNIVKEIAELTQEIAKNLETLEASCLPDQ